MDACKLPIHVATCADGRTDISRITVMGRYLPHTATAFTPGHSMVSPLRAHSITPPQPPACFSQTYRSRRRALGAVTSRGSRAGTSAPLACAPACAPPHYYDASRVAKPRALRTHHTPRTLHTHSARTLHAYRTHATRHATLHPAAGTRTLRGQTVSSRWRASCASPSCRCAALVSPLNSAFYTCPSSLQ